MSSLPETAGDKRPSGRRKTIIAGVVLAAVGVVALVMVAGARAKARFEKIQCANILSSLGLAARTYASDYEEVFAPNLQCMSNEISTTKVLICPGDRERVYAGSFAVLGPSNVSYVYLASGLQITNASTAASSAIFRCPIHGHTVYGDGRIVLGDGTVQYGKRFP